MFLIYKRIAWNSKMDRVLKKTCLDVQDRYETQFLEIRSNKDHVHSLV
ncbi:transposase [Aquimarina hainanensis]|uniref:Transposase n=1 Tax=Aquimarina hainanensis TaxID=1578017 RepID=A0ABW5NBU4_9FLAO